MSVASFKFRQMTFDDILSATSSPEFQDGVKPCDSPDGPPTGPSGLLASRVSRSRRPANGKAKKTTATCGPSSLTSSPSAALQSSLANRLAARMACRGSMEYVTTLKQRVTPSGRLIFAVRASVRNEKYGFVVGEVCTESECLSAHHTSDNGCTGWPSPKAMDSTSNVESAESKLRRGLKTGLNLPTVPQLAGWPTASASGFECRDVERLEERRAECKERHGNGQGFGLTLGQAVMVLVGFPTPDAASGNGSRMSADPTSTVRPSGTKKQLTINDAAQLAGWATPACADMGKVTPFPDCPQPALAYQVHLAGWSTPTAGSDEKPCMGSNAVNQIQGLGNQANAVLAGWNTPLAQDARHSGTAESNTRGADKLVYQVQMAGWGTPTSRDAKDGACQDADVPINGILGRQVPKRVSAPVPEPTSGPTTESSHAKTARRGGLNPALSAWLMGFRSAWLMAAPERKASRGRKSSKDSATPSSRKSRRRSSGQ